MNQDKPKYFNKARGIRFTKFFLIGTIGWGLNELLIFLCILVLDKYIVSDYLFNIWFFEVKKLQVASLISILVVVVFNFSMNKLWTFKNQTKKLKTKTPIQFLQFFLIGLSAAMIYVGLIYLLHNILGWNEYLSTTLAFYVGLINNFIWNDLWTFNPNSGMKNICDDDIATQDEQLDQSAASQE